MIDIEKEESTINNANYIVSMVDGEITSLQEISNEINSKNIEGINKENYLYCIDNAIKDLNNIKNSLGNKISAASKNIEAEKYRQTHAGPILESN